MLGLVDAAATAVVESLTFARESENGDEWEMNLGLIVFFETQAKEGS